MIAKVSGASFDGLLPIEVGVEVSAIKGLPKFEIVGMGQTAVKEGSQRIQAALDFAGVRLKNKKITVNLAPAGIKKNGAHLDLPIALGILRVLGIIPEKALQNTLCFGELSLDGSVRSVKGGFALVEELAYPKVIFPSDNLDITPYFSDRELMGVSHLRQLIDCFSKGVAIENLSQKPFTVEVPIEVDFSQVCGQHKAKRMLEVAAAGGHHVMLSGPPGVGKTLLARAFPTILPALSPTQKREVQKIYSASGYQTLSAFCIPPLRSPHHHASKAGMVGGGHQFQVGEFTLAHQGVLFMDEFPEFRRDIIEALREPLEEGMVRVRRASGLHEYPAQFQLLASMNLCPCGNTGDPKASCTCTHQAVVKYQKKISRPIADRIDLWTLLPKMQWSKVWDGKEAETSQLVQNRVTAARSIQHQRWGTINARASLDEIKTMAHVESSALSFIQKMVDQKNFSVRSMVKTLRVARTIADLAQKPTVGLEDTMEALQYRYQDVDL